MATIGEVTNSLHTEVRPWGTYWVIDEGDGFQVKRLEINPGNGASYHRHAQQFGHWTIISGTATVTFDGAVHLMHAGESVDIPAGVAHRIENKSAQPLVFVEILLGKYIGEDDIERLEDNYGREGTRPKSARSEYF